jgi:hypothetical protein
MKRESRWLGRLFLLQAFSCAPAQNVGVAHIRRDAACRDERVCSLVAKYSTRARWDARVPFDISDEECSALIGRTLSDEENCQMASAAAGTAAVVLVQGTCEGDWCATTLLWAITPGADPTEIREAKRQNRAAGIGVDVTMDHRHAVVDLGLDLSKLDESGDGVLDGTVLYTLKDGTSKMLSSRSACVVSGRADELLCRGARAEVFSVSAETGRESLLVEAVASGTIVVPRNLDHPGPGTPILVKGKLFADVYGLIPGVCSDEFACEAELQVPWPLSAAPVAIQPALIKWACHGRACQRIAPSPLPY